ncbi:cysteine proteinase inhibitor 6-like [Phalaenopsis equestris]|uniref:cysteine proteinase inhibitor 6-like n=1 Tax=Phalaenopsis equestris TaxID=78828 RepID=UPI0009E20767|nr:cysteine proteinase inhibitor 6-like [Phalaenopsis equestris]
MKSLLPLSCLLLAATLSIGGRQGYDNGWLPLKNLDDEHVRAIALFAVTEQNRNSPGPILMMENVGSGETQWVYGDAGVVYRLVLVAYFVGLESYSEDFEVTVWDKGCDNFQLMSFSRLQD